MAKQHHQNRLSNKETGLTLEQNTAIDDNLLPPAEELSKIKDVDANFLPWIRERTAIEQDARIKFNDNRIELAGYDLKKTHRFNISALLFGFLVFLLGITFSAFLIYNNLATEGTIFGGSIMLAAVIAFVRVAKK